MPKISVAGASHVDDDGVCRTFESLDVQHGGEQPPVAEGDYSETDEGGAPSAGSSSSESTGTPGQNSNGSDQLPRPTAPSAETFSPQEQTGGSDAGSPTTTRTTESGTTSPDDEDDQDDDHEDGDAQVPDHL